MSDRAAYGGQAVIEGVMIRGKTRIATAVRMKDDTITVRRDAVDTLSQRHRWLRLPILRGTPALIDSLKLGYRTLMWSADLAMEGEGQQQKPTNFQYFLSIAGALLFAILLFKVAPALLTRYLFPGMNHLVTPEAVWWQQLIPSTKYILPNVAEGAVKLAILVVYILLISRMRDIKRVFCYHGAEHKVVNAWEAGAELTVDGARGFSRIHPRCGTSFLFLFFTISVLLFALLGYPGNVWLLVASRLVMIPIIAGVSYEVLRLAGKYPKSWLVMLIAWPGMLLQRLTTAEPDDRQLEVALASMRAVLEDEGEIVPLTEPAPEQVAIA